MTPNRLRKPSTIDSTPTINILPVVFAPKRLNIANTIASIINNNVIEYSLLEL